MAIPASSTASADIQGQTWDSSVCVGADPDYSEIIVASGVSDAVEAMVRLGRLDEAEGLTALIERNGSRLDRPWMLSVAGRCRSTLLAARGDVAGAVRTR